MKKRILCLLLTAALCLSVLTGCGSAGKYEWTNEYGAHFTKTGLDYENFDINSIYDEQGNLKGIKATDYVTLPEDYEAIPVTVADYEPTDEQMESYVNAFMEAQATVTQVTDRAIADGDTVNIDYVGSVDGVKFTGGDTQGLGVDVVAGSTDYVDDFLTKIIGHKPGENFDIQVTFPVGYTDGTDAEGNTVVLENKEAVFNITVNYIQESAVPELTDEWVVEQFGDQGLTGKDDVYNTIKLYYCQQNLYTFVTNYLMENSVFADELPQKLLDYSAAAQLYALNAQFSSGGGTVTQYLELFGYSSTEAYLDEYAEAILTDVKSCLLSQLLSDTMDIHMTAEEAAEYLGDNYDALVESYGERYTLTYANAAKCYGLLTASAVVQD